MTVTDPQNTQQPLVRQELLLQQDAMPGPPGPRPERSGRAVAVLLVLGLLASGLGVATFVLSVYVAHAQFSELEDSPRASASRPQQFDLEPGTLYAVWKRSTTGAQPSGDCEAYGADGTDPNTDIKVRDDSGRSWENDVEWAYGFTFHTEEPGIGIEVRCTGDAVGTVARVHTTDPDEWKMLSIASKAPFVLVPVGGVLLLVALLLYLRARRRRTAHAGSPLGQAPGNGLGVDAPGSGGAVVAGAWQPPASWQPTVAIETAPHGTSAPNATTERHEDGGTPARDEAPAPMTPPASEDEEQRRADLWAPRPPSPRPPSSPGSSVWSGPAPR